MRQSPRNDNAQVTLALAADYLEVLATARSARLLPARRCLVALVREFAAARAGEPHDQEPGKVYVVVLEPRTAQPPRRLWKATRRARLWRRAGGTRPEPRRQGRNLFLGRWAGVRGGRAADDTRKPSALALPKRGSLPRRGTRCEPRQALGDCGIVAHSPVR